MPRNKNAARRGRAPKSSRGGRGGRSNGFDSPSMSYEESSTPKSHKAFTLQDEARNTERHHSFWNDDQRLRYSRVNFVSAGKLETREEEKEDKEDKEDQDENESALAKMSLGSPPKEILQDESGEEESPLQYSNRPDVIAEETTPLPFVLDPLGTTPIETGLPPPQVRATSPTPSNSSEEIILFRGRDRNGRALSKEPKRYHSQAKVIDEKIKIVEDKIHEKEALLEEALHIAVTRSAPTADGLGNTNVNFNSGNQRSDRSYGKRNKGKAKQATEDALYADYIANVASDDDILQSNAFKSRDLGGSDDDLWLDQTEQSSDEPIKNPKTQAQGGWDSSDLRDFDGVSTSDEFSGEVEEVLSKREHKSGPRYLVVLENQSVDEARWIPASTMTTSRSLAQIETFEREAALLANIIKEAEDSTESDSDDEDLDEDDEEDEEDDEEDLIQRKIDQMSDEKIARLLSKQEELGMGSNELLLFDDNADEDDEVVEVSEDAFFTSLLAQNRSKPKGRGMKRPRGEFPAAHALADAYDGFDVLDFDRPSLKKKPKGRKGKLVFDLSDSELEASMQMAWDNDRIKKKERKQEREELRSQGLLRSKNGKPDLKGKYKEGMGIHAVKEEIKNFLMSSHTTLSLPPMDKADRKVVHEIANAFKLKSKSMGAGKTRFPVLYRTTKTSIYAEGKFAAVEARLTRRFLPRMDISGRKSGGRGSGFGNAAVSYRDGDIVGGSAPELGIENKGRAMLEKMGWSTGTALGAINNKGILQPVSHVVKTTKAGLG
ncbi:hypothetical protein B0J14DRAFT_345847 [Halenospora varia]|nr:hypothetical protein B0J14DRAFT_345847 [Halenospora varia]